MAQQITPKGASVSIFDSVTIQDPRPLPVVLLVDTSGSMTQDNRIGICNDSVREMLRVLGGLGVVPHKVVNSVA